VATSCSDAVYGADGWIDTNPLALFIRTSSAVADVLELLMLSWYVILVMLIVLLALYCK
jgi:hypothetical protein